MDFTAVTFALCFREKRSQNIEACTMNALQAEQEHFSQTKDTGECFSTKLKSTCKSSGTFEGKRILAKKVTCACLAPNHSIE